MELLQLRYFLAAAKYQHMTKAAEHLQIAQPALSQAIHRLETELGVPLFIRRSRGIELNETGLLLQQRLLPIIESLDRIPEELREGAERAAHTIHLRLLAATALMTRQVIAYRALHPEVCFHIHQWDSSTEEDICVTAIRGDESLPTTDSIVLFEEDLVLAVPIHSSYAELSSICLKDTKEAGYISFSGSRPMRKICDYYLAQAGVTPHILMESDGFESIHRLLASGLGVGFWPSKSWDAPADLPVRFLSISEPHCSRRILLHCSHDGLQKPLVMDFCRFLKQTFSVDVV